MHDTLCREYGLFRLTGSSRSTADALADFFLTVADVERALDVIQLGLQIATDFHARGHAMFSRATMSAEQAIEEVNARFRQHGIGYQFESGEIVRVDSEIVHQAVVRPTLQLLRHKRFALANAEFLGAHEHYRHGRLGEAINECLKAFESVLKVICAEK